MSAPRAVDPVDAPVDLALLGPRIKALAEADQPP
jgi:hypothetical protein